MMGPRSSTPLSLEVDTILEHTHRIRRLTALLLLVVQAEQSSDGWTPIQSVKRYSADGHNWRVGLLAREHKALPGRPDLRDQLDTEAASREEAKALEQVQILVYDVR